MTQEPTNLEVLNANIIETRKLKSDIRSFINALESVLDDLTTVEIGLCNCYERAADVELE